MEAGSGLVCLPHTAFLEMWAHFIQPGFIHFCTGKMLVVSIGEDSEAQEERQLELTLSSSEARR